MASEYRGIKLIGNKQSNLISTIEVIDIKDNYLFFSPAEYRNKGAEPHDFKSLLWEEDLKFVVDEPKLA